VIANQKNAGPVNLSVERFIDFSIFDSRDLDGVACGVIALAHADWLFAGAFS